MCLGYDPHYAVHPSSLPPHSNLMLLWGQHFAPEHIRCWQTFTEYTCRHREPEIPGSSLVYWKQAGKVRICIDVGETELASSLGISSRALSLPPSGHRVSLDFSWLSEREEDCGMGVG